MPAAFDDPAPHTSPATGAPGAITIRAGVIIVGGGIAGLWTLDELVRRGVRAVLIERDALGAGQTVWSQGIVHGGLKYTLSGLMNPSAEAIREMPAIWRDCLAGRRAPDLSSAPIRAPHCHLWRTDSLASRAGMIGAKVGLRVAPTTLSRHERPAPLTQCPGDVARLDEQVIDAPAVLRALAAPHQHRIVRGGITAVAREQAREHTHEREHVREHVRATVECGGASVQIVAGRMVITAGNGAAALRQMLGLAESRVQVRPLRMAMLRGPADVLPALFGHCVDGAKTRVTITSAIDAHGRRVWQVGGEVAERGVSMPPLELARVARREVLASIPGLDTSACAWSCYDAPRAELATPGGRRPDDATLLAEGAVLTAFPTKLALAPRLAQLVAESIGADDRDARDAGDARDFGDARHEDDARALRDLCAAHAVPIATPPWDEPREWINDAHASGG
jgi:glycine/D-amino acid oxidase-like deaminating enzyme